MRAQHLEKTIPPHLYTLFGQKPLQQKVQLARAQARLDLPFLDHQRSHQTAIHSPALPRLAASVIVLPGDPHLAANCADANSKAPAFQLYGLMSGCPAAFFLNPSTSVMPARLQARRVYAR